MSHLLTEQNGLSSSKRTERLPSLSQNGSDFPDSLPSTSRFRDSGPTTKRPFLLFSLTSIARYLGRQGLKSSNKTSLLFPHNRMRTMAATWENIARTLKPTSPIRSTLLHYILPASFSSRCSKSHNSKEGRDQESSKTYVRYAVHQKRADAKSALKNLLFNGKPVQSVQDQTQRQRKLKTRHLNSIKEKRMRKRGRMDEGDEGNFTWTWAGETFTFPNSGPSGFEWRDNSNWHQNKKFYNESDVEDECQERSNAADLMIHRATLGLPRTGPLILDHIKSAFRSAALKWHPDKYEGPSKATAEEKFKLCVDAYKALSLSLTQQG